MAMGKRRGSKHAPSGSRDGSADGSPTKHSRLSTDQQRQGGIKEAAESTVSGPQSVKQTTSTNLAKNSTKNSGKLDFAAPENLLTSLFAPDISLATFFAEYWERKPLVVHRGGDRTSASYYGVGFSRDALLRLLAEYRIVFGQDVNVCRYIASKRENLNGTGRATAAKIKNLFEQKKATLQLHQPQRFQDELWRICELLESYFHSLVGANVYMTPGGSQGLAPHYDDVEVLILQLEGKKHWRLYPPPTELPRDYSQDLSQDDIGQPTHDFVLETGDFLYFPRGTVHQADTPVDCPYSTHVTISTYQRSSYGDLLGIALPSILNSAVHGSKDFRKGLPRNSFTNSRADSKSTYENLLGQLSNHIGDHLQQAANQMMCDFVANRLPPYKCDDIYPGPVGPMPTDSCKVRLTHPRHTFVALMAGDDGCSDDEDDDGDDDDEGSEDGSARDGNDEGGSSSPGFVVVRHSITNSRTDHMMDTNQSEPKGLLFPASHHQALLQLTESADWLDCSKLSLPQGLTKGLLVSLWAEGLLLVSK